MPLMIYSQNGITFKIEELKKPDKLLPLTKGNEIFQDLILSDVSLSKYEVDKEKIDFSYNIIANSKMPDSLVSMGYHSFFNGMYMAYADHRPFVISPDMIWLLISQGFAQHIANNAALLRKDLVNFDGKQTLIVQNNDIMLDNPESPWEKVFPEFTKQIGGYTGTELINALTCDFTTTTPVSKVASEITVMKAMEPYFDFVEIRIVCGIPEITLEGTTQDWQKVLEKAKYLRQYKLAWWIDEIEPLLKEFVNASKGKVDEKFWRNMFKYHSQKKYGAPKIIDGWIVRFFPYDKNGRRNKLKILTGSDNLPEEIVKVDLKYITTDGNTTETVPLELWAGFAGLEQNPATYALKPQMAWMIRKKDVEKKALLEKLKWDNTHDWGGITIAVKTFPKELLQLKHIKNLEIYFLDAIDIPDEISQIKIDFFRINGIVSKADIERIRKLLPDTKLIINRKEY